MGQSGQQVEIGSHEKVKQALRRAQENETGDNKIGEKQWLLKTEDQPCKLVDLITNLQTPCYQELLLIPILLESYCNGAGTSLFLRRLKNRLESYCNGAGTSSRLHCCSGQLPTAFLLELPGTLGIQRMTSAELATRLPLTGSGL